ncbi:MAG: glucose 1-dehydrogenase [Gammaproteobacteria bacterium]|nr:glucose 1-dehydrogenase [Gammaproteobacteria bacterium]
MFDFSGKVVLVTGAASGLGLDCAAAFVEAGAQVMMTDVQVELGMAGADRLGERAAFLEQDVRDEARWQQVVEKTVGHFGGLNVLVNAAGIAMYAGIEETTLAQFRNIHAVNVEGVFLGCKSAIPAMRGSGGGSIINLSSTAGLRGVGKLTAYCSAKGAVRMLTKSVAVECAEKGDNIRCNSLHPSYTDTPMVQGLINLGGDPQLMRRRLEKVSPMNRLGEAREVSNAILFLASDQASFITGAEIPVDGGTTAR